MLGEGIQEAVKLLPKIEIPSVLPNRVAKVSDDATQGHVQILSMWIEDVKFGWPLKLGSGADDVRYVDALDLNPQNRAKVISTSQVVSVRVPRTRHHIHGSPNWRDQIQVECIFVSYFGRRVSHARSVVRHQN